MKKVLLSLTFILLMNQAYSFEWDAYEPYSLMDLVTAISNQMSGMEERQDGQNLVVFSDSVRIPFIMDKYPIKIQKKYAKYIDIYGKILGFTKKGGPPLSRMFDHQLVFEYQGKTIVMAFQGVLIDPLREEIPLNGAVDLYAVFGLGMEEDNVIVILVNEFQARL